MISKERLYRTLDGRIVPEGDVEAAFLVVGRGCEIEDDEAESLGILDYADTSPPKTQSLDAPVPLATTPTPLSGLTINRLPDAPPAPPAPPAPKGKGKAGD